MKPFLVTIFLASLSLIAVAQSTGAAKPGPINLAPATAGADYALTPDEAKAWDALAADEAANARALDAAIQRAVNTGVGAVSIEIHGQISQAGLALDLARTRRAAFLAQLQARESCKGCGIENGKLIPPKEAKK